MTRIYTYTYVRTRIPLHVKKGVERVERRQFSDLQAANTISASSVPGASIRIYSRSVPAGHDESHSINFIALCISLCLCL